MSFEMEQVRRTQEHIRLVGGYLQKCVLSLFNRSRFHDASKFSEEEWLGFLESTEHLKSCTYGSDAYKAFLKDLQPTLDHHYANNKHHPEHFVKWSCNGCFTEYQGEMPDRCEQCGYSQMQREPDIAQMTLLDLLEMLCDWIAATARHADGDILKSIEINQKRFGYSDELKAIMNNTVTLLTESSPDKANSPAPSKGRTKK